MPGNSVEHSSRCSQVQAEQQEAIGGKYLETGHWKFDLDRLPSIVFFASFIQVHPLENSSEHWNFGILVRLLACYLLSLIVVEGVVVAALMHGIPQTQSISFEFDPSM